jgi:hypothetical protein
MVAIFFVLLAVILIIGSALILLKTATIPKIPGSVKSQPYSDDDEDDDWV